MKTVISKNSIIVATKKHVSGDLAGSEAVILNLDDNIYYGLNEVGNEIWKQIQKPIEVTNILQSLIEDYDVSEDQCESEVLELLNQMANKGLIEAVNEAD